MAPIYIPPQPVPVIRQKIRNISDIQEQLRAYDRQQQDLVGANATAFNATNLGRTNVLYPAKLPAEEEKIEIKPPEPEIESLPSPPSQPATPEQQPAILAGAEEIEQQTGREDIVQQEQRRLRPLSRGRKIGQLKPKTQLIYEIREAGHSGSWEGVPADKLREMAMPEFGIDPMR